MLGEKVPRSTQIVRLLGFESLRHLGRVEALAGECQSLVSQAMLLCFLLLGDQSLTFCLRGADRLPRANGCAAWHTRNCTAAPAIAFGGRTSGPLGGARRTSHDRLVNSGTGGCPQPNRSLSHAAFTGPSPAPSSRSSEIAAKNVDELLQLDDSMRGSGLSCVRSDGSESRL
jgi:hypothetical protein